MRVVIQRVASANVYIDNALKAAIAKGLLVLLGVEERDKEEDVIWLTKKIAQLRIFNDENNLMNLSVKDIGGDIIVVSQFTLHAMTKKGARPSFIRAAKPELAVCLYNSFLEQLEAETGRKIRSGDFGAYMKIELINDGPVTIIIDSRNKE